MAEIARRKNQMNPNDKIVMTRDLLNALKTEAGAFTSATVEALGLSWQYICKHKGWTSELIGKSFTNAQIVAAHEGRNIKKKNRQRIPKSLKAQALTDEQYWYLIKRGYPKERVERLSVADAWQIIAIIKANEAALAEADRQLDKELEVRLRGEE